MTDQFVSIDGGKIRYRDSGGDGPAVLMTHGIGESLEFWHRQFDGLGHSVRLIAWDMPGHGLSDERSDAMSLEGQAKVAWLLLNKIGVDGVHLVGNSLGAAMSLRMADQAPERVASLLLANSAALGPEVFGAFRLMTLPLVGELMNRPGPTAVTQQINAIVFRPDSITPEVRAAIERNVYRSGGGKHFLALLRKVSSLRGQHPALWHRSHQILRELKAVPVLFVHGAKDVVLPVEHSRLANTMTNGSKLVVFDNCGHTPQLEKTSEFNELIRSLSLG